MLTKLQLSNIISSMLPASCIILDIIPNQTILFNMMAAMRTCHIRVLTLQVDRHLIIIMTDHQCQAGMSLLLKLPCFLFFHILRSGAGAPQVPWTAVRSGTEVGLLSLGLNVTQGALLGDFLFAPVCPIEKVPLWVDLLY